MRPWSPATRVEVLGKPLEKLGRRDSSIVLILEARRGIGDEIWPSLLGLGGGRWALSAPGVAMRPGFDEKILILPSLFEVAGGALVEGCVSPGRLEGVGGGYGIAWGMFMAAVAGWKAATAAAVEGDISGPPSGGEVGEGSVAERFRMLDCIARVAATSCCGGGGGVGGCKMGSK